MEPQANGAEPKPARRKPHLSLLRLRRLLGEAPLLPLDHVSLQSLGEARPEVAAVLERERDRLRALEVHEAEFHRQGCQWIAGVDEVGRGPLAGPVVAAAVVFEGQPWIPLLNDSKALSADEREALFPLIQERAVSWSIGEITVPELDHFNMHHACLEAMRRALAGLSVRPEAVLVDGCHRVPALWCQQQTLVKGDAVSLSIAAASIVAKVTRDRYMDRMDALYPQYGLRSNKGYGTPEHLAALRRMGPCPLHRTRFAPVASALQPQEPALELFSDM